MKRREFLRGASLAALASSAALARQPDRRRIAFGGIQIECSTYGRILSRMEDFTVRRGAELADSRFFAPLTQYPHPFLPTLLATAVPGGPVERKTYEALRTEFLQRLRDLLPLEGLYLPMHGAMYVEGMQDAEGDWISAAREVVGKDCLELPAINAQDGVLDASLLVGYVWADEQRATASAVLTGTRTEVLRRSALTLAQQYWDARAEFRSGVPTGTMAECISRAQALNVTRSSSRTRETIPREEARATAPMRLRNSCA